MRVRLGNIVRVVLQVAVPCERLGEQPIFLDVHLGNVRMLDNQFLGFIDCDHICLGPRLRDISGALSSMVRYVGRNGLPKDGGRQHQRALWLEHFGQYLSGYNEVSRLTVLERDTLWLAMLCCCFPGDDDEFRQTTTIVQHMEWFWTYRDTIEAAIAQSLPPAQD